MSEPEFLRVTEDSIGGEIASVDYLYHKQLVICVVTMKNGFFVVGRAAPVDPLDPGSLEVEAARRYAHEDALEQIWRLEVYRRMSLRGGRDG